MGLVPRSESVRALEAPAHPLQKLFAAFPAAEEVHAVTHRVTGAVIPGAFFVMFGSPEQAQAVAEVVGAVRESQKPDRRWGGSTPPPLHPPPGRPVRSPEIVLIFLRCILDPRGGRSGWWVLRTRPPLLPPGGTPKGVVGLPPEAGRQGLGHFFWLFWTPNFFSTPRLTSKKRAPWIPPPWRGGVNPLGGWVGGRDPHNPPPPGIK